ncbi:MAG: MoaD/ThiS family protein [Nitrososphaerales archaeon]
MIKVKALGSIGKMLGSASFTFDKRSMALTDLVKIIYRLDEEGVDYSRILSDVLIAVNGVALSSGIDETVLESGDEVTLIPITHGG